MTSVAAEQTLRAIETEMRMIRIANREADSGNRDQVHSPTRRRLTKEPPLPLTGRRGFLLSLDRETVL